MKIPYIYTSDRELIRIPVDYDNQQGVQYEDVGGEHAIWIARVPFLPSFMSDDFTRLGKERIRIIVRRQYRFIYDLSRSRENQATFELRFISTPNPVPGQPNAIDMVFLGKVFSRRHRGGFAEAVALWDKFAANFPLEDPFNYPLEPVSEERFQHFYQPFEFSTLTKDNILELRKYEDMPVTPEGELRRQARKGDYIVHPFVPSTDFNPMGRFFEALAVQQQKCFASISLRPAYLFPQEIQNVSFQIGQFRKGAAENDEATEEYIRTRSIIGLKVYQRLMMEREHLLMVRVHVVGENHAPYAVAEALGSEMMDNGRNEYPTQWNNVQPSTPNELESAVHNLRWLEHDLWGETKAVPQLERLRYLASASEASGAFRLPVPSESGYMPGVLVKSEPFVAPADYLERDSDETIDTSEARSEGNIDLGYIYHRGKSTAQKFTIPVSDFTRHTLIAGSTGAGKTTTIMSILAQMWSKHRIPFMVLYPIDKTDYRALRHFGDLKENLLVFSLGDETTSPFRFNPFEVPEGMLLKTHLSRLMRVFSAAFSLMDPLPMIYRDALRRLYRNLGWNPVIDRGQPGRQYPVMSEFHSTIDEITNELNYGREVQDNVRQASVIRIGDLLENAGYVVNVRESMPISRIMQYPTVMEIGRVGSMADTALLMGFLLMRLAGEIERNPRPRHMPHITVVEEAHRLMSEVSTNGQETGDPRSSAGEDFSNILAEVRGFGEGIIIAEQIPTLLVKGAIGNTYIKVMHWLEDVPSYELFSNVMNLNDQQREYARTLQAGHAIVRSPFGRPVHIKIPRIAEQQADNSDKAIAEHMAEQRTKLDIRASDVIEWTSSISANTKIRKLQLVTVQKAVSARILDAPMQTCAHCIPLLSEGKCPYRHQVKPMVDSKEFAKWADLIDLTSELDDPPARWTKLSQIGQRLFGKGNPGHFYCLLAHLADRAQKLARDDASSSETRYQRYRDILNDFQTNL